MGRVESGVVFLPFFYLDSPAALIVRGVSFPFPCQCAAAAASLMHCENHPLQALHLLRVNACNHTDILSYFSCIFCMFRSNIFPKLPQSPAVLHTFTMLSLASVVISMLSRCRAMTDRGVYQSVDIVDYFLKIWLY